MKSLIILFTLLFFLLPSLKYHRESFTNVNQVVLPVVLQKDSLITDGKGNYTYSLCGDDLKWRKKDNHVMILEKMVVKHKMLVLYHVVCVLIILL